MKTELPLAKSLSPRRSEFLELVNSVPRLEMISEDPQGMIFLKLTETPECESQIDRVFIRNLRISYNFQ